MAQKWNYETHRYERLTFPNEWHCPLTCRDMDERINCASCGGEMKFGDGYTSRVIHTSNGFGYSVCEACYSKELMQERRAREEDGDED